MQEKIDSNALWALQSYLRISKDCEREFLGVMQAYRLEFTRKCARLLLQFVKLGQQSKDDITDCRSFVYNNSTQQCQTEEQSKELYLRTIKPCIVILQHLCEISPEFALYCLTKSSGDTGSVF